MLKITNLNLAVMCVCLKLVFFLNTFLPLTSNQSMVHLFLYRKILSFSFPCSTTAFLANLESVKCNESGEGKSRRNLTSCFQIRIYKDRNLHFVISHSKKPTEDWQWANNSYIGEKQHFKSFILLSPSISRKYPSIWTGIIKQALILVSNESFIYITYWFKTTVNSTIIMTPYPWNDLHEQFHKVTILPSFKSLLRLVLRPRRLAQARCLFH